MVFPSKQIHRRYLLVLAALFLTFTVAVWSQDAAPSAPVPAAPAVPATPGAGTNQTPGVDAPSDAQKPTVPAAPAENKVTSPADDTPIEIPVVKPVVVHADRDAEIGHVVAELMEQVHYLQKPITPEMSQRWLKNYFLALDPTHLFFLQSDIDEFTAKYGNNLGDLILQTDNDNLAVSPAFEIFDRYMLRVKQDVGLAEKLVHDKSDFTKDETFAMRTSKSTWFPDAATSEAVWRGQIKSDLLNGVLEKKTPEETTKLISKRYVSFLREGSEEDDMDILSAYLSALTHAYDPHSDYFSPEQDQNFNIQAIKHTVTGIGAVLKSDDGYATIEEVIPGGPADLDKRLQPGDRILAVGQGTDKPVDAVYMKLDHVVDMIRGRKGTMVRLVVAPAGAPEGSPHKILDIKRDEVSIKDSLASAHIIEHRLPNGATEKIGVVDLHDFYDNTAVDVAKLIDRLKKEQVAGIILDLRNNGGGLLDQAVDLTGLFVKHEPVVQIRRSDGYIEQLPTEDSEAMYDGPLIVMVNRLSASATEIVAAALQDYGRAIIIGDQSTHGKGTVQTLIPLDDKMSIGFPSEPGAGDLKVTVQKFYRIVGGSTQQKGVVSDIVLPSRLNAFELGETTLPYYLPYDTVAPVPFDYLNETGAFLPSLRQNSAARVAASPDFDYVRQDIAYYKKKVDDSTISLNEAARLKEEDDLKATNAERKKYLESRKPSRDTMLDLTLDMVDHDQPAAPPVDKTPKLDASDDSDDDEDAAFDAAMSKLADDPQLDETVNIMSDYTQMLRDSGSTLVQASPTPGK
jgi:carboxyl-terminal processing protease